MMNKKISVIIPIYNNQTTLERCLKSLTMQNKIDIEFICIDDGSTDDSLYVCEKYHNLDNRFNIYSKKHEGTAATRNYGLKNADGDYIAFLDADDFVKQNTYYNLTKLTNEGYFDSIVFGSKMVRYMNKKAPAWIKKSIVVKNKEYHEYSPNILSESGIKPFIWSHLIRSSLLKDNHIKMDSTLKIGEDQAFILTYLRYVETIRFVQKKYYFYDWNRSSSTMNRIELMPIETKIKEQTLMVSSVYNEWKSRDLLENYEQFIICWSLDMLYPLILKNPECNFEEFKSLLKIMNSEMGYKSCIKNMDRLHKTIFSEIID